MLEVALACRVNVVYILERGDLDLNGSGQDSVKVYAVIMLESKDIIVESSKFKELNEDSLL